METIDQSLGIKISQEEEHRLLSKAIHSLLGGSFDMLSFHRLVTLLHLDQCFPAMSKQALLSLLQPPFLYPVLFLPFTHLRLPNLIKAITLPPLR